MSEYVGNICCFHMQQDGPAEDGPEVEWAWL